MTTSDIHGVAEWTHDADAGDNATAEEREEFNDLCLKVLQKRYPNVVFENPGENEYNRLVRGNNWPVVTDQIGYEAVIYLSVDELREELSA